MGIYNLVFEENNGLIFDETDNDEVKLKEAFPLFNITTTNSLDNCAMTDIYIGYGLDRYYFSGVTFPIEGTTDYSEIRPVPFCPSQDGYYLYLYGTVGGGKRIYVVVEDSDHPPGGSGTYIQTGQLHVVLSSFLFTSEKVIDIKLTEVDEV